ncbi:hypothetical protein ABZW11_11720 [Nonomuraea sp. NPDC004580]|uniref:hypothetical protein n=1 Tax=Nonomuraea sp. NPDC004580 TaxID=3154552 RepID=UPI0033B7C59B
MSQDLSMARYQLERALFEHARLPLRSDRHREYLRYFVDVGDLQRLRGSDWLVVYGRRGTGKTLLLGALQESLHLELEAGTSHDLALYFTGYEFRASPTGVTVPDRVRGLGYFQVFMDDLATRLSEAVDTLLGSPSWGQRLLRGRAKLKERIERILLSISEMSQTGMPIAAFSRFERSQKAIEALNDAEEYDLNLTGSVGVTPKEFKLGAKAGAGRKRGFESRHIDEMVQNSPAIPRFVEVRKKIVELLEILEISTLHLLIDEWSALDSTATSSIQPLFAELLKVTFSGSPRISVKIAGNRYQTRFSNLMGGTRHYGLEVGADIFVAVDLDRSVMTEVEQWQFYETMLYRRLLISEPRLDLFDADHDSVPDSRFLSLIFDSQDTYHELVRSSEGIPRRFLRVFNAIAERHNYRLVEPWKISSVREAIIHTMSDDMQIGYHSEASQLLNQVQNMSTRRRSRVFYIRKDDYPIISGAVDELMEKRLIHALIRSDIPPKVRLTHEALRVDYGLWLDWMQAAGNDLSSVIADDARATDDPRVIPYQTIHTSKIDRTQLVTCSHCEHQFPRSTRSYEIRGICPNCFLPPLNNG